jgi:hypothetical protein
MTINPQPNNVETFPVYCLACCTLNPGAAGVDKYGHLICPSCKSIDCYPADIADGYTLDKVPDQTGENDE